MFIYNNNKMVQHLNLYRHAKITTFIYNAHK